MGGNGTEPLVTGLVEALERGLLLVLWQDTDSGEVYLSCTADGRSRAHAAAGADTLEGLAVVVLRALGREPTQWCSACEQEHPLSHFGRYVPPEGADPAYWPNGRFHRCLKSERERMRAYCARRRQRRLAAHGPTEGRTA